MALESSITKQLQDGTLTLIDGAGATLELAKAQGDFSVSGLQQDQRSPNVYRPRGQRTNQTLRKGNHVDPTGSFSVELDGMNDAVLQTVIDFVLKQGAYAGNTSTTAAEGDLYTLDIQWDEEGISLGDAADHQLVLEDSHIVLDIAEGEPNMQSFSFTCLGLVDDTKWT